MTTPGQIQTTINKQGFIHGSKGYAAAIVLLLFLIIALVTAFQFWLQKRWVHYE